jgi:archaellum component FlaF (FlaF/FlaG flagellin family)
MENAIPSLIIGAVILAAIAIMGRGSLESYQDLGTSLHALETRLVEKTSTQLTVQSPTVDPSGDFVTLNLRNDGQTRIASFERLDMIVTYYDSPSTQVSAWLPYNSGGPAANAWTLVSILDDGFEPGILNPGETAQLRLDVNPGIAASQTNSLVISTELGSTVEAAFTS